MYTETPTQLLMLLRNNLLCLFCMKLIHKNNDMKIQFVFYTPTVSIDQYVIDLEKE